MTYIQTNMNNFYIYKAMCVGVYDGDTVTLDIDLGFNHSMNNQKIRLFGINTPEVRGIEREAGLVSKQRVKELILSKNVTLISHKDKTGKYGRWLGTIIVDGINVNQLLLDEGLAKPY